MLGTLRTIVRKGTVMAEKPEQHPEGAANRGSGNASAETLPRSQEPRGIQKGIADADKIARTGSTEEPVRDTPPAGAWNDTAGD